MKRATLKDIAAALEVNPSTISRALNNHPDVSKEMREKVKQVAELLQYTPNLSALNLKSKKTKTIGLILPTISKFFIPNIIDGIVEVLNSNGYKLVILSSDESVAKEKEHIKMCCYTQMDGIIISLTNQTDNIEHLKLADDFDIPIVMFDKIIQQNNYSTVTINDKAVAQQCVKYLLDKNCKNILGVFGNKNLTISNLRLEGMMAALKEIENISYQIINADNIEDAMQQTTALLNIENNIDGVFCMSDEVLTGVTYALYTVNKLFDITTTAISDGQLIDYRVPKLSFVKHDGYQMGILVAQKLIDSFNFAEKEATVHIEMNTKFFINKP